MASRIRVTSPMTAHDNHPGGGPKGGAAGRWPVPAADPPVRRAARVGADRPADAPARAAGRQPRAADTPAREASLEVLSLQLDAARPGRPTVMLRGRHWPGRLGPTSESAGR